MNDLANAASTLQEGQSLTVTISRSSNTQAPAAQQQNNVVDAYYEDCPDDYVIGQYSPQQQKTELQTVVMAAIIFMLAVGTILLWLVDWVGRIAASLSAAGFTAIALTGVIIAATAYVLQLIFKATLKRN